MFTEEELRAFTDELGGMWASLEREIVVKLCTRVKEIGKLAPADTHKLIQLAHVSGDISGIQQSIAQTLSVSEQAVHALYEQAAQGDDEFQAGVLEKLGKPVIPFEQNTFLQGLIADVVKVTNGEIRNMTRTTGFTNRYGQWEQLSKVYQDTIDYAIMQVRSGVVDYHSAMRSAVQKLADEGLQHIEYDNPGKRYYRRRLDSSVRNAFSGGMQRLSQAQNERLGRQFGANGMEVTFHRGARPTHAEMGGRQYPMKQYNSEIVPLLMENNCYHRAFPILLGISPPTYGGKELAALKAQDAEKHTFEGKEYNAYEARQMQRRMETAIRRQKDRAVAAGKAGDKEGEQTALIKGAVLNQKYAQFSKAAGLSYKSTRVTAGLNRSQSARLGAQTRRLNAGREKAINSPTSARSPSTEQLSNLRQSGRLITGEKDLKLGFQEFREHVENMEEPYKSVYRYYSNNTDLVEDPLRFVKIGYDPKKDVLVYNARASKRIRLGANIVYSHELAHRYDFLAVKSWENPKFTKAIAVAAQKVSKSPEKYNALYKSISDVDPAFQDILSAVSNNRIKTQFKHAVWADLDEVAVEIFANLSYIHANQVIIPEFDGLVVDISREFLDMFKGGI